VCGVQPAVAQPTGDPYCQSLPCHNALRKFRSLGHDQPSNFVKNTDTSLIECRVAYSKPSRCNGDIPGHTAGMNVWLHNF
jgi:hypothetical protein